MSILPNSSQAWKSQTEVNHGDLATPLLRIYASQLFVCQFLLDQMFFVEDLHLTFFLWQHTIRQNSLSYAVLLLIQLDSEPKHEHINSLEAMNKIASLIHWRDLFLLQGVGGFCEHCVYVDLFTNSC